MTKLDMLNLYLNERLKVAADEIFQVIKDTILEYQNEIALTKEENRDLKQRLSDVGTISAGIQRVLSAERQHLELEPPSACEYEDSTGPVPDPPESPEVIEVKYEESFPIPVTPGGEEPQEIPVTTPPLFNTDNEQRLPNTFPSYSPHMSEASELDSISAGPSHPIKTESCSEECSIVEFNTEQPHSSSMRPDCAVENRGVGYLPQSCVPGPSTLCGRDLAELPPQTSSMEAHHARAGTPFYCSLCGRCFGSARDMTIHRQLAHGKEKPYRCGVCGKSFRYSGKFKEHQRIHTGERPYRCHVCFKGFNQTAHLKVKREVSSAVATPAAERPRPQRELLPAPPSGPQLFILGPVTSQGPVLVAAPQALGASLSSAAPAPVRKQTRHVLHNKCKKCGQFRTAETGHSQYKGIIYCPSVEAVPREQWLEDIKKRKCMK